MISLAVLATGQIHLAQMCWAIIRVNFWVAALRFKPRVDPLAVEPEPGTAS